MCNTVPTCIVNHTVSTATHHYFYGFYVSTRGLRRLLQMNRVSTDSYYYDCCCYYCSHYCIVYAVCSDFAIQFDRHLFPPRCITWCFPRLRGKLQPLCFNMKCYSFVQIGIAQSKSSRACGRFTQLQNLPYFQRFTP